MPAQTPSWYIAHRSRRAAEPDGPGRAGRRSLDDQEPSGWRPTARGL